MDLAITVRQHKVTYIAARHYRYRGFEIKKHEYDKTDGTPRHWTATKIRDGLVNFHDSTKRSILMTIDDYLETYPPEKSDEQ